MLNNIDANQSPVVNGNGSQAYDFIYVKDIAKCNILALLANTTDEFYNVGTGIQTTIDELCSAILRIKESSIKVHYKPYSKDDARQLVKNRIGSTEKAANDLGFNYEYDLETGLKALIKWRENN